MFFNLPMLSLYTTDWAAAVTPSALHHDFENNSALSEAKLTEVLNHGNAALADKTWLDYDGLSVLSTATGEPGRFMLVHHSRTTTNQDGEEVQVCLSGIGARSPIYLYNPVALFGRSHNVLVPTAKTIITSPCAQDTQEGLKAIIPAGTGTQSFARAMFLTPWLYALFGNMDYTTSNLFKVIKVHIRELMWTAYQQGNAMASTSERPSIQTIADYYSEQKLTIPHHKFLTQAFAMTSGLAKTPPTTIALTPSGGDQVLDALGAALHKEKLVDQRKPPPANQRETGTNGKSKY